MRKFRVFAYLSKYGIQYDLGYVKAKNIPNALKAAKKLTKSSGYTGPLNIEEVK